MTQTLTCEHGNHTWERPSQRGRKPRFCPEHKPVETTAAEKPATTHASVLLAEQAIDQVDSIVSPEDRRQVLYIAGRLLDIDAEQPNTDERAAWIAGDAKTLEARLRDLIRPRTSGGW